MLSEPCASAAKVPILCPYSYYETYSSFERFRFISTTHITHIFLSLNLRQTASVKYKILISDNFDVVYRNFDQKQKRKQKQIDREQKQK